MANSSKHALEQRDACLEDELKTLAVRRSDHSRRSGARGRIANPRRRGIDVGTLELPVGSAGSPDAAHAAPTSDSMM